MATSSSRNLLQRCTRSARTFLSRSGTSNSVTSGPSKRSGVASTCPCSSPRNSSFFSSRLPVEMGCCASLMPLHSVTASALLKSMLSSKVGYWGHLSEGFATPL